MKVRITDQSFFHPSHCVHTDDVLNARIEIDEGRECLFAEGPKGDLVAATVGYPLQGAEILFEEHRNDV